MVLSICLEVAEKMSARADEIVAWLISSGFVSSAMIPKTTFAIELNLGKTQESLEFISI